MSWAGGCMGMSLCLGGRRCWSSHGRCSPVPSEFEPLEVPLLLWLFPTGAAINMIGSFPPAQVQEMGKDTLGWCPTSSALSKASLWGKMKLSRAHLAQCCPRVSWVSLWFCLCTSLITGPAPHHYHTVNWNFYLPLIFLMCFLPDPASQRRLLPPSCAILALASAPPFLGVGISNNSTLSLEMLCIFF